MAQLIIYAVIAVAALGAIYGFDRSRQAIGEKRVLAEWAPVIEECKALKNDKPANCAAAVRTAVKGRDDAVAANASLQQQMDTVIATHNAEVAAGNAEYERLKATKAAAATTLAPKLAQIAMDKFDLIVQLKAGGITCEQLDAELAKMAPQRFRDYGPAKEPQPGDGGVKIVQPVNPLKPKP